MFVLFLFSTNTSFPLLLGPSRPNPREVFFPPGLNIVVLTFFSGSARPTRASWFFPSAGSPRFAAPHCLFPLVKPLFQVPPLCDARGLVDIPPIPLNFPLPIDCGCLVFLKKPWLFPATQGHNRRPVHFSFTPGILQTSCRAESDIHVSTAHLDHLPGKLDDPALGE